MTEKEELSTENNSVEDAIEEQIQDEDTAKEKNVQKKKKLHKKPRRKKFHVAPIVRWSILILIIALIGLWSYTQKRHITSVKGLFGMELTPVQTVDSTDTRQWSYAVGHVLGQQLEQTIAQIPKDVEIDTKIMSDAIRDILTKKDSVLTSAQVEEILQTRAKAQQEEITKKAEENQKKGEEFMAQYRQQDGVKETENGTLYKVITKGAGYVTVGKKSAKVHYTGKLIDGTEFDSSYNYGEEPVVLSSERVVPGFGEVLEKMHVGDKWEIVIPSEQAYGVYGAPGGKIGPGETLIFELEVAEIE